MVSTAVGKTAAVVHCRFSFSSLGIDLTGTTGAQYALQRSQYSLHRRQERSRRDCELNLNRAERFEVAKDRLQVQLTDSSNYLL